MKSFILLVLSLAFISSGLCAQENADEQIPMFKGYDGNPGTMIRNHYFNFLSIKDESGEHERQSTGRFWELRYTYDSLFRQKQKFYSFMISQINDLGGILFFQDTTSIDFAIPVQNQPNYWGKVVLSSDMQYTLKLIREMAFDREIEFDVTPKPKYDQYVEQIELPPRINYVDSSLIVRARYSKFNHMSLNYITKDRIPVKQRLMGPYWDMKFEVQKNGTKDTQVSTVQVHESYYRAAIKAGGSILKSRSRELIFTIPYNNDTLWVRVMASMDGIYFVRAILQSDADKVPPESFAPTDSTKSKIK